MTMFTDIDILNDQIRKCSKCSTRQEASAPVCGEGPVDASVFICGRAPGKEEDIAGRPFIGKGGEQLNKFIPAVGLQRTNCYISNLVKCYPRGDRANTDEEIDNCIKYLSQEIEFIRPKLVIAMGKQPVKAMLGLSPVTKYVGKFFEASGIIFVPICHVSAVLKDRGNTMQEYYDRGVKLVKKLVKDMEL